MNINIQTIEGPDSSYVITVVTKDDKVFSESTMIRTTCKIHQPNALSLEILETVKRHMDRIQKSVMLESRLLKKR